LLVRRKSRWAADALGLTPQAVLEKLAKVQRIDVWFPATDGRQLGTPRHTEPEPDQGILMKSLCVLP
jgi:hypothetical protein